MRDHLQHNLYPSVNYSPFNPYSRLNIPVESLNIFSVSHYTRSTLEVLSFGFFFFFPRYYLFVYVRGCKSLSLEAVGGFLELPFIENHGNIQ